MDQGYHIPWRSGLPRLSNKTNHKIDKKILALGVTQHISKARVGELGIDIEWY
jgi:hypothetical protein